MVPVAPPFPTPLQYREKLLPPCLITCTYSLLQPTGYCQADPTLVGPTRRIGLWSVEAMDGFRVSRVTPGPRVGEAVRTGLLCCPPFSYQRDILGLETSRLVRLAEVMA